MTNIKPIFIPQSVEYCIIEAPFACLGLQTELVQESLMISKIDYLPLGSVGLSPGNALAKVFENQCARYFIDAAFTFDLPLKPTGTAHQQKVWDAISGIKAGNTASYGEIARGIQSGPRAVGWACGANPYPLVIPCHRVVSTQGIGGFMGEDNPGFYRQIKVWLLKHEGAI
ncbi:methylated-DNA--[protein]-cysteine S-methyltransferase [Polynucleobacter brandtiae]|uniref:Methylated-DNA-[protein]-cysteine S-methyltransferase n=1 Tax=Polynucleobacter brandtiae TaxID=1938816 RepID=A0A2M8VRG3_9BURK|nr:methylated-DNA--[protein]-cysteine S-methyltransferase [Polynucleobacter brandtiae]PJI80044.1 methylated-DNA-[protein]-cysteine S-methyltransferase [Polynucleobacter brandtiae]